MQGWLFYYRHLERVSRSFSFCIAELSSPQREWISLSYLLFRIADTIEDSKWLNQEVQFKKFDLLKQALESPLKTSTLCEWEVDFPGDIPSGEKLLIADTQLLLADFYVLPCQLQRQLSKNVKQMIDGMKHFISHHSQNGELVLKSDRQLNQYCFFVAGIVGELLTVFFAQGLDGFELNESSLMNGFHFALFLQKINILKDQRVDNKLGRNFISSRTNIRNSLYTHATKAFDYIKSLPVLHGRSYRLFCAWSLFIGLASLKWIDKNYLQNKNYKISYSETMAIIFKIKSSIDNNRALEQLFTSYLSKPQNLSETGQDYNLNNNELPQWFKNICSSPILDLNFKELGL